jgi:deoxyribose-phosphate aldolase
MKDELGRSWLEPSLFRFGASSMLADIERQLEHHIRRTLLRHVPPSDCVIR